MSDPLHRSMNFRTSNFPLAENISLSEGGRSRVDFNPALDSRRFDTLTPCECCHDE